MGPRIFLWLFLEYRHMAGGGLWRYPGAQHFLHRLVTREIVLEDLRGPFPISGFCISHHCFSLCLFPWVLFPPACPAVSLFRWGLSCGQTMVGMCWLGSHSVLQAMAKLCFIQLWMV